MLRRTKEDIKEQLQLPFCTRCVGRECVCGGGRKGGGERERGCSWCAVCMR